MKSPWLQTEVDLNAKPSFAGASTLKTTQRIWKVLECSYSCFETFTFIYRSRPIWLPWKHKQWITIKKVHSFYVTLVPALWRILKFELLHGVKARFDTHVSGTQHTRKLFALLECGQCMLSLHLVLPDSEIHYDWNELLLEEGWRPSPFLYISSPTNQLLRQ